MDELYAAIGRKQLDLDALHREYDALLGVLAEVASGAIALSRVAVDRSARTWTVAPPPASPIPVIDLASRSHPDDL